MGGTVDYVFGVAGTVRDPEGHPLEGVKVTLEVGRTVYQAIQPVRRQEFVTTVYGGFQFTLITHHRSTPYVLVFEKPGYVRQSVGSASPPAQEHAVTLRALAQQEPTRGASALGERGVSPNNGLKLTIGGMARPAPPLAA
jgi:hypothetical protein